MNNAADYVSLSSGCNGFEEKGKNAAGGLGSSMWVGQGRLHSKGETAAKSSRFAEVNQGWPLKPCSAFSATPGSRSQMPFSFFPFFLDPLFLVLLPFSVGFSNGAPKIPIKKQRNPRFSVRITQSIDTSERTSTSSDMELSGWIGDICGILANFLFEFL